MRSQQLAAALLMLACTALAMSQPNLLNEDVVANSTPEEIQAALAAGIDLEARDSEGVTPLMAAAALNDNPEVVRLLLNAGADATMRDERGMRAIDHAQDNSALRNSDVYWLLNDASFQ